MRRSVLRRAALVERRHPWQSPQSSGGWQLVQDIRLALEAEPDSGLLSQLRPQLLGHFVRRAREALHKENFSTNAAIFYWLSKASKASGYDVDQDLLLQWTNYVRHQSAVSSESQLVKILQSLIQALNRNKLLRALDSDAYSEMDKVCHELCREALPRLLARHQHLSLSMLSVVLSSYASIFRPEYESLFEVLGHHVAGGVRGVLAKESDEADLKMLSLHHVVPFILDSYSRAGYQQPELLEACFDWAELEIHRLTYEMLDLTVKSLAVLGCHRPRFWDQITRQLDPPCVWPTRAVAKVLGPLRRLLLPGTGPVIEDGSLARLFHAAATELLRRPEDWDIYEATEVLLGLAALPRPSELPEQELIQLSCEFFKTKADLWDIAPIFVCNAFFGAVALDLTAGESAAQDVSRDLQTETALAETLELLADHTILKLSSGLRVEMELAAQILLALAARVPKAKLDSLQFGSFVRVNQREVVRCAPGLGSGFSRCAAFATAAVWPWREEWLQPWFLEEVQRFRKAQTGAETKPGLWDWLDAALPHSTSAEGSGDDRDFGAEVVPWPSGVAWYLRPSPAVDGESALLRIYGPETRAMGWASHSDDTQPEGDIPGGGGPAPE